MHKLWVGVFLTILLNPAFAYDDGYYSSWQSALHLLWPPKADNLIRDSERIGPYPLLSNPVDFQDGFKPRLFNLWQQVNLSKETGAICGNGSEYKFYIRRVNDNHNYLFYLEGGGACWDYESCSGQEGVRGARNPDGIPDNYIFNLNTALVSPFIFPPHYEDHPEVQNWNLVYVPYCTGDIYAGDRVEVYDDPEGINAPLEWHHNGFANMRAINAWLRDNMQQPARMMVTGCSAGGTGSLVNYHLLRRDMSPTSTAYLFNDSGPIFPALQGSEAASLPLHRKINQAWGLDNIIDYISQDLPHFSVSDLGTINSALAQAWPDDRLAHVHFQKDLNYSAYSYERFYDYIESETDVITKWSYIHELWQQDTDALTMQLDQYDNFAYYLPQFRDLNESHCASIIEFNAADIQEEGQVLSSFIADFMDPTKPLLSFKESNEQLDYDKGVNAYYLFLNKVLGAPITTNPHLYERLNPPH
ncbi:pectin acetylesterase-family hydrolase [uncultured Shewanella sp.]|uniref:pectin acetylesterase-family hydrolase n=1 Tax=uncultured Shewanella sp. TaxID=173975 RepID=UPI0026330DA8|nr:pectin acetylesterase-family hydrolase [uncultured Shewanella sp.]